MTEQAMFKIKHHALPPEIECRAERYEARPRYGIPGAAFRRFRWPALVPCFQALDMSGDPVPRRRPSEHRWRLLRHFYAGHDPLNHFLADRPLPASQFVKMLSMLFRRAVDTKLICDRTNSKFAHA
jgi:hypothetical protein